MATPAYNPALVPPGDLGPRAPRHLPRGAAPAAPAAVPFADVLVSKTGVQFSNHALQRLQRRGIAVDRPTLDRLNDGVERAAGKGEPGCGRPGGQTAFVVSVRNRPSSPRSIASTCSDHVFTNIDSAVIA